jgi:phosphoglycerol transferase MdoB-like AlkP superfamily enzyme
MVKTCLVCQNQLTLWTQNALILDSQSYTFCKYCVQGGLASAFLENLTNLDASDYEELEIPESADSQILKSGLDITELVRAQNRTTYAVRSLAISLVLAPIVALGVLLAFFIVDRFVTNFFIALLIIAFLLFACIRVVFLALRELRKSEIP